MLKIKGNQRTIVYCILQFENKCITQSIGCNGNGNCEVADNTAGWRCLCNDTHIGDECQLDNPCEPNPCSSGMYNMATRLKYVKDLPQLKLTGS